MRKIVLTGLVMNLILLVSCKNNDNQKQLDQAAAEGAEILTTECYQALYEQDTVSLQLNTLKSGKVSGRMEMNLQNAARKTGDISGEFKGDTLFINYTFTDEGTKAPVYKNPMALLKKGDQLIIGNGTIQVTMGVSYLAEDQPIDFDKVKYKLQKQECIIE